MWGVLLALAGGVFVVIGIISGEPGIDVVAGVVGIGIGAALLGAHLGGRGIVLGLVLAAVGGFGGWVFEQFHDGASIDAYAVSAGGLGGSGYVGIVHNHEEKEATVTCQLEALDPGGGVIGTAEVTVRNMPPNSDREVDGEVDVPGLGTETIQVQNDLRGSCSTGASS
jgi:hypothetical protein